MDSSVCMGGHNWGWGHPTSTKFNGFKLLHGLSQSRGPTPQQQIQWFQVVAWAVAIGRPHPLSTHSMVPRCFNVLHGWSVNTIVRQWCPCCLCKNTTINAEWLRLCCFHMLSFNSLYSYLAMGVPDKNGDLQNMPEHYTSTVGMVGKCWQQ